MRYWILTKRMVLCLFAVCVFTACSDSNFPIEEGSPSESLVEGFGNGYSLNVKITLDDMGGTRAAGNTPHELKQWEDYIDPEKIRILFFDDKDLFLFESKSRWVKQLIGNQWLISVPVFTYGNDVYEDEEEKEWDWKTIRTALTSNSFKIAILANRPEMEWYPSFADLNLPPQWIDNTGPHWTPKDTRKKSVFDLHHCQYDPLYHAKSKSDGFYDFIMGGYYKNEAGEYVESDYQNLKPQMGATSSWCDWNGTNERRWTYTSSGQSKYYVNYILPDKEHPIPMYGIQKFEPIPEKEWQEGTPFNLSDNIPGVGSDVDESYKDDRKSIWLLRSVVKLELLIPKKLNNQDNKVNVVSISYPNPYARCEPMNVWEPTDELWNEQHPEGQEWDETCEKNKILNYGRICKSTDTNPSTKFDYQHRIAWFYGAWCADNPATGNKWWFNQIEEREKDGMEYTGTQTPSPVTYPSFSNGVSYPQIFNTCIQRNTSVLCDNSDVTQYYDDDYYHYVVYTGERNVNDPSDLGKMGDDGGGKPTVQYWGVSMGVSEQKYYAFPITDYTYKENPANQINNNTGTGKTPKPDSYPDTDTPETLTLTYANGDYQKNVMGTTEPNYLPWPLIRNHVYRLTLTPKKEMQFKSKNRGNLTNGVSKETGNSDFIITSEDNYTKRVNSD